MLRRTNGVELPPLVFETIPVDASKELLEPMEAEQAQTQDAELRAALAQNPKNPLSFLESNLGSYSALRRYTALAKLPAIAEIMEQDLNAGMDKIVLFGIHVVAVEWLAERLKKFHPILLYGKTPANKKQQVVDKFQCDPNCRILLGNIHAAGIAVTLTSGCEVGFIEKSWVPGDNAQALKRCHRRGQTRTVRVRSFVLYGSADEQVDEALDRKIRELAKIF
jgi:SNF2 family DNA or RNA helicase